MDGCVFVTDMKGANLGHRNGGEQGKEGRGERRLESTEEPEQALETEMFKIRHPLHAAAVPLA